MKLKPIYEQFIAEYTESEETRNSYMSDLNLFDKYLESVGVTDPLKATKLNLYECVATWQSQKLTERTIRRRIACLKRFYRLQIILETIAVDPTMIFLNRKTKPLIKNPKALSEEQRQHLIDSLQYDSKWHWRISLAMLLGLYTGMRRAEIARLKWDNVDFAEKQIKVMGKGSKELVKYMPDYLIEKLKEYGAKYGKKDPICGIEKNQMCRWAHIVKGWCGWGPEVTFTTHVLRHTYATYLLDSGVELTKVSAALGHGGVGVTMNYLKLKNKDLNAELDRVMNKKETK